MDILIWLLVGLIFVIFFVILPFKRQKALKEDRETHSQFLNDLRIGEKVLLSSGIYGVIKKKEKHVYHVEVAPKVVIEIIPRSVVGKDKRSN